MKKILYMFQHRFVRSSRLLLSCGCFLPSKRDRGMRNAGRYSSVCGLVSFGAPCEPSVLSLSLSLSTNELSLGTLALQVCNRVQSKMDVNGRRPMAGGRAHHASGRTGGLVTENHHQSHVAVYQKMFSSASSSAPQRRSNRSRRLRCLRDVAHEIGTGLMWTQVLGGFLFTWPTLSLDLHVVKGGRVGNRVGASASTMCT